MDEHLIFFIDILGFQEAVSTWEKENKEKLEKLTELLRDFASLRSDYSFAQTATSGGQPQMQITPAVTTFSDHVVMSYPTEHLRNVDPEDTLGLGLLLAKSRVGALAGAVASLGLLIRGGITVGPLHHSGGVVLGEAMNEAYYLESRVSIYPRIAVSRKVYSRVGALGGRLLLKDNDGITHLDYFDEMLIRVGVPFGRLRPWLVEAQRVLAENIDRFERAERWNELAKWVWFKNRLEKARSDLPDVFFQEP